MKKEAHNQTKEREGKKVKEVIESKKRNYISGFSSYHRSLNHLSNNKY